MDKEDNLISELDSGQARAIDSVIGKKIWNIEVLEDGDAAMVRIFLSEDEENGDSIVIHGDGGMDMYILNAKPKVLN